MKLGDHFGRLDASTTETAKPSNQELATTIQTWRERRHWTPNQWREVVGKENWPLAEANLSVAHNEAVDALVARVEALLAERDAQSDNAARHWLALQDDRDEWKLRANAALGRVAVLEAALREIQNVSTCEPDAVEAATIVSHLAGAVLAGGDAAPPSLAELEPAAVRCYDRVRVALPPSNPSDPDDPSVSLSTLMAILHAALAVGDAAAEEKPQRKDTA